MDTELSADMWIIILNDTQVKDISIIYNVARRLDFSWSGPRVRKLAHYCSRWTLSDQLHIPVLETRRTHHLYPMNGLDGPQSWSGQFQQEENFLLLQAIKLRFLGSPARSLVTIYSD